MSTVKGRSIKVFALALGLLVAVGVWLLVGSRPSDNVSPAITEQWMQIYYDPDSPDTGMDGDVTIVAFLDYGAGDCRDAAVMLNGMREADKRVRLVSKHIPTSAPGPDFAARAALAADKQDMFLPLAIVAALKRNKALMGDLGISALPAFIVGGQLYRGAIDHEALSAAVARVRKNPSVQ